MIYLQVIGGTAYILGWICLIIGALFAARVCFMDRDMFGFFPLAVAIMAVYMIVAPITKGYSDAKQTHITSGQSESRR